MQREFRLNIPISKVDEEKRMVWGIATTEAVDSQRDIVDYEASKAAFANWLGNIREMHGPVAVGKCIETTFDDEAKQVMIGAYVSESADGENAWVKVKEGVLQGFSIGGSVNKVKKEVAKNAKGEDVSVTRITDYDLAEVSLVDNPANPEAMFVMVKSMKGGLQRIEKAATAAEIRKEIQLPGWYTQFMIPMEKAQALYDNSMKKGHNDMKKGMWDASFLLDLAIELGYYINGESYEGEDVADLEAALATIKAAVVKELTEPTAELTTAVELAQKLSDLHKSKKAEKSAAAEGEITKSEDAPAEEPKTEPETVEAPAENAEGEKVEDAPVEGEEAPAGAETDKAPEKAEVEVEDKPSGEETEDAEKSVTVQDLRKFSEGLIEKLGENNKTELAKMVGELTDKVEKSLSSLEGRIKSIEDQPAPSKAKASYAVVSKGEDLAEGEEAEVQKMVKRRDELAANPNLGTMDERLALTAKLRKAQAAGYKLTVTN